MPYSNITHWPRPWNKETHPVVGHVSLEASRWSEFQRVVGDQTQSQVLGHDEAEGGLIDAHVACTTEIALRRLSTRWSA